MEKATTLTTLLRQGTEEKPLFCLAGVQNYQALADAFTRPLSVYGICPRQEMEWIKAIDRGERTPVPSIEENARESINALRKIQPHGPYRLAGHSYGGVVAYEIAQQFQREGEEVEALVLLDTRLPRALIGALDPFWRFRRIVRSYVHPRKGKLWHPRRSLPPEQMRYSLLAEAVDLYERRIEPYPGSAMLMRASDHDVVQINYDASFGWGKLIGGELTAVDCPGEHYAFVTEPGVAQTAKLIEAYLDRSKWINQP